MAVADNRQRFMPLPDDRLSGRCQTLAYPEAVLLVNPKIPEHQGEVLFLGKKYIYLELIIVWNASQSISTILGLT